VSDGAAVLAVLGMTEKGEEDGARHAGERCPPKGGLYMSEGKRRGAKRALPQV